MRIACIYLPHFPLWVEATRDPSIRKGGPLVLFDGWDRKKPIISASEKALKAGVQMGMTLAQALSRRDDLVAKEADFNLYEAVFQAFVERLMLRSDRVEAGPLGCLWAAVSGLEGIYGSEENMAEVLLKETPSGIPAMIGIGDGKFIAHLAARNSEPNKPLVVQSEQTAEFLAPFKSDVLPVSDEAIERLRRFGLTRLGHLQQQDIGPLQAQFGREGVRIWQLARGIDTEPLVSKKTEPIIEVSRNYEPPLVTIESVWVGIESLLGQAFRSEQIKGKAARGVTLTLDLYPEEVFTRRIVFKEPISIALLALQHLKSRLPEPALIGAVAGVNLKLWGLTGETGRQQALFADIRAEEGLRQEFRQLKVRLGIANPLYQTREVNKEAWLPEERSIRVDVESGEVLPHKEPQPIPVKVDKNGEPVAVFLKSWKPVLNIQDCWRVEDYWRSFPIKRAYFSLQLIEGGNEIVFHDEVDDGWFTQQRS